MPVLMIRYKVAEDSVADVANAFGVVFAAVTAERPDGIRYAYLRDRDSTEFIALLEVEEGVENPLPGIEAARSLQATVAKWAAGTTPTPQLLDALGT